MDSAITALLVLGTCIALAGVVTYMLCDITEKGFSDDDEKRP